MDFAFYKYIICTLRAPLVTSTCRVKSWYVHQAYFIKFAKTYKHSKAISDPTVKAGAAFATHVLLNSSRL